MRILKKSHRLYRMTIAAKEAAEMRQTSPVGK